MSMVKQHRTWLLVVALTEQSNKFLTWVEEVGTGKLLFVLLGLLTTTLRELLNIYIPYVSSFVLDPFLCAFNRMCCHYHSNRGYLVGKHQPRL